MAHGIDRAVKHALEAGTNGERFELPVGSERALARAMASDLSGPDPRGAVEHALRLVAAFSSTLESPTVAEQLRGLLRASPEAMGVVESLVPKSAGLDEVRHHARREGRQVVLRAPSIQETAAGGLKIKDFLDPAGGIHLPRRPSQSRADG